VRQRRARLREVRQRKRLDRQAQHPRGNHGRRHRAAPEADGSITVDMGAPVLEPKLVPFDAHGLRSVAQGSDCCGRWSWTGRRRAPVLVSVVSMGNPHAVQVVDDVEAQDLEASGPLIERHPRFPAASTPASCRSSTATT
jgi:diaminopimelate epimerase